MVTEHQVSPDLEVTETEVIQDIPEVTEADTEQAKIDWQARYQEAEAEKVKLNNDLKALRGSRLQQQERDDILHSINDRMDAMERRDEALFKALGDNNPEVLPSEMDRINQERGQDRATQNFVAQYGSLWEDLQETLQDEDKTQILDFFTAPELADIHAEWKRYHSDPQMGQAEKIAGFARLVGQSSRVVRQVERARAKEETKKVKDEARANVKEQLNEAGVIDLDLGPGAGAGSDGGDAALWVSYGKGQTPWSAKVQQAGKNLGAL